jgi:hypothetical protein
MLQGQFWIHIIHCDGVLHALELPVLAASGACEACKRRVELFESSSTCSPFSDLIIRAL